MTPGRRFAACIAAEAVSSFVLATPPRYVHTDIGIFDERFPNARLWAVNDAGESTGSVFVEGPPLGGGFFLFVPHAIRFSVGDPPRDIGNDPAIAFGGSDGLDINNAGVIAGEAVFPDIPNRDNFANILAPPTLWFDDAPLALAMPPGMNGGRAEAVNNKRIVAGDLFLSGVQGISGTRGFIWFDGTVSLLDPVAGVANSVRDLNDDGWIVGWTHNGSNGEASLVRNNTLNFLRTGESPLLWDAIAVNNSGQIVGRAAVQVAFLWHDGEQTALPQLSTPTSQWAWPRALNDSGQIVGAGSNHAVLWRDGDAYDLTTLINNLPDNIVLRFPTGVNNAGQIVGVARNDPADGLERGFFLDPVTPDLTKDGVVDSADLLRILSGFGSDDPHTDLDGSGVIDGRDLLRVLNDWGPVPARDPREAFEMFKRTAERQAAERLEAAQGPDLDAIDRATRPFAPRDR